MFKKCLATVKTTSNLGHKFNGWLGNIAYHRDIPIQVRQAASYQKAEDDQAAAEEAKPRAIELIKVQEVEQKSFYEKQQEGQADILEVRIARLEDTYLKASEFLKELPLLLFLGGVIGFVTGVNLKGDLMKGSTWIYLPKKLLFSDYLESVLYELAEVKLPEEEIKLSGLDEVVADS